MFSLNVVNEKLTAKKKYRNSGTLNFVSVK